MDYFNILRKIENMAVDANQCTSEYELSEYGRSDYFEVRRAAAGNVHTSQYMLNHLAADDDDTVVEAVARNPVTNGETLRSLSKHDNCFVRIFAAKHSNMPSDVLAGMAENDVSASVVHTVAYNKNTPQEVRFAIFLEHPEWVK